MEKWLSGNKRSFCVKPESNNYYSFYENKRNDKSVTNMEQELIKLFEAADGDKNKQLSKG